MKVLLKNKIYCFTNKRMNNNTYIIVKNKTCAIIDISWNFNEVNEFIINNNIKNICLLFTHCHYDHIADIDRFLDKYPETKIYVSQYEAKYLNSSNTSYVFKSPCIVNSNNIIEIQDNQNIEFNDLLIKTYWTPGHSIGSTTYKYSNFFFTGDFIFANCIGRIDLETSDINQMYQSLKNFINIALDSDYICPGHEEINDFGTNKKINFEIKEILNYFGDENES